MSDYPDFANIEHRKYIASNLKNAGDGIVADACEMIDWLENEISLFLEQRTKDHEYYLSRIREQEKDLCTLAAELRSARNWADHFGQTFNPNYVEKQRELTAKWYECRIDTDASHVFKRIPYP